ncbi:MAG: amine oxidase [Herbinix sp.]|jgi:monoamine oxidase|nr:amine oxidase [Herbinix sp.]
MDTPVSPNIILNPTDEQRHEMLRNSLISVGRPEDYDNIIRLLSPPPDITNFADVGELKGVTVGIIGGGMAGLTAAFELRKLGFNIKIIDSLPNRVGGRVYTYYFDEQKTLFGELGPMRIPVSHETTWYYLNLFGLNTFPFIAPGIENFLYVRNTRMRQSSENITRLLYPKYMLTATESATPWNELNNYAFNYPLTQLSPEVRTELLRILPTYSPEYLAYINMSVRDAFESLGLSQEAISLISGVDSATGALLDISYDEILQEVYSLDFLNLYRVEGGMSNFPGAFYRSLTSPNPPEYPGIPPEMLGEITYLSGYTVNGIFQNSVNGNVILRYRSQADGQDTTEEFEYVVCAIPYSSLRVIEINPNFSVRKMQAILEYNYLDAQKTLFLCNHRFWEMNADYGRMNGGISFTDLPIQSIIYPSDHVVCSSPETCSPELPGVLNASYNLNLNAVRVGNLNEARRIELVKRNVEQVHGLPIGYLDNTITAYRTIDWNSSENFLGAFALAGPGQKYLFDYYNQIPEYNYRIYIAGEHASVKHGWMQGALYTGKSAANALATNARQRKYS